jgi:hypothetical protein
MARHTYFGAPAPKYVQGIGMCTRSYYTFQVYARGNEGQPADLLPLGVGWLLVGTSDFAGAERWGQA